MRLVTFAVDTPLGAHQRVGALASNSVVVDLAAAYAAVVAPNTDPSRASLIARSTIGHSMIEFFQGGRLSLAAAKEAMELAHGAPKSLGPSGERIAYDFPEVRLLAPVPRPNTIRDTTGFRAHLETYLDKAGLPAVAEQVFRSRPMYYKANPDMVVGPDENVAWPSLTRKFDFEIEPCIFVGTRGINLSPSQAREHIAGYTIFNDFSLRDYQDEELSLPLNLYGVSKSKDTGHYAIGPCIVTVDEFDATRMTYIVRVNGDEWVRSTDTMTWTFEEILAFASLDEPILPGDCIAGGAPPGGCGGDLGRWIQRGDVIECEIPGIGILRNRVVEADADNSGRHQVDARASWAN